jgi:hypothetical protein|tara:strand:+ start:218 stop:544 length:327 start_codon:yes stop_codon:yes gene_type:complete
MSEHKRPIKLPIVIFVFMSATCIDIYPQSGGYEDDPYWLENDAGHMDNDQNAYHNSEYHPDNSRYRTNADNIIRGKDGEPMGYSVEKEGGGTNYFLYDNGGRYGYDPD